MHTEDLTVTRKTGYPSSNGGDGRIVASLITDQSLKEMIAEGAVVLGGNVDGVEGIKYDFRLGNHFLKASLERPVDFRELTGTDRAKAKIEPGEVVFVMSEETLKLPLDMFVVLVQKRKISHDGIAVMGGLCVDPGYEGHLLVGLYNFSSSPFQLEPGRKLIAGLFYKLQKGEVGNFPIPAAKILNFPDELVKLIKSYQPINLTSLVDQISGLKGDLTLLQREISDDKKWRQDFKEDLDGLLTALKEERDNRQDQYKQLEDKIVGVEKNQIASVSEKSVWDKFKWILVGAVIAGVITIGFKYIPGIVTYLTAE